jgi:hypothetical protein
MEMKSAYDLLKDLRLSFSSLERADGIPSASNFGRFVNGIPVEWKSLIEWFQNLKESGKNSKFRHYIARPSNIKACLLPSPSRRLNANALFSASTRRKG